MHDLFNKRQSIFWFHNLFGQFFLSLIVTVALNQSAKFSIWFFDRFYRFSSWDRVKNWRRSHSHFALLECNTLPVSALVISVPGDWPFDLLEKLLPTISWLSPMALAAKGGRENRFLQISPHHKIGCLFYSPHFIYYQAEVLCISKQFVSCPVLFFSSSKQVNRVREEGGRGEKGGVKACHRGRSCVH